MWEQFIARCNSKGTTATATLTRFIELYLDGSLDDLDAIAGNENKRLVYIKELFVSFKELVSRHSIF
ncbi:hypothetical protein Ava_C0240 (plasmid) [Trichormus variabilis ATCC 29413]|uniref:Uncharacterized protein n=2 Tax=Nostocales TaxID=1161 RepID=Q3M118_TRIV2|nr:hypothetical protein Ava_C0240 [Trichormus variabilis ATCC 29413]